MSRHDRPRSLQDLTRLSDTASFLYLEHCAIDRKDLGVVATDASGTVALPVASLSNLALAPGTRISHRAVMTIADHGCGITWTGEAGVRFYAAGSGRSRSSRLAERQAELWANPTTRRRTARLLYQLRFPGENVSRLSIAQLRGREGARVKRAYRDASLVTGVPWVRRHYDRTNWALADPVNQALSVATSCLYGVCHSAISALGLSPALGFIHTGDRHSLVFDIADLYKADTAIPAAFEAVASGDLPLERAARRACRDQFHRTRILERSARDLTHLFSPLSEGEEGPELTEVLPELWLWDPDQGPQPGGTNYDPNPEPWS